MIINTYVQDVMLFMSGFCTWAKNTAFILLMFQIAYFCYY